MTFKFGTLVLLALSAATMSAAAPVVVEDIYSQSGKATLSNGSEVVYSFGNWHAGEMVGTTSLYPALFDEMLASSDVSTINAVCAEVDGVEVKWNEVEKVVTVNCEADKLGRTSVLIADLSGANRGIIPVNSNPTQFTLSNIVSGAYVVAVAVDGKLIKTFKIYLK